jgi:hypothetical protein
MVVVNAIPNLILSPQQNYFVGHGKQIWPTPHLVNVNKFKPYQLFMVSQGWELGVQGGGGRSQWTIKSGGWHTTGNGQSSSYHSTRTIFW